MKPYFFLTTLTALLFLAACKKDKTVDPIDKTKLLKSITSSRYNDTTSFAYNSSGQMIQTEGSEDRSTISVSGNQLHFVEFRKTENRETANATFTLNAQGNVVSGQGSFSYNLSAPYTAQYAFAYDGAGNLISRTETRNNGDVWLREFTWTNGDITTIKWIFNGALYLTINMEYYTDKEDKIQLDWDKFLTGTNSFFGNSNQHLIKHTETIFAPGSTVTQEYEFAYNLDTDGYPSTATVTGITSPSTNILTYYYQ